MTIFLNPKYTIGIKNAWITILTQVHQNTLKLTKDQ